MARQQRRHALVLWSCVVHKLSVVLTSLRVPTFIFHLAPYSLGCGASCDSSATNPHTAQLTESTQLSFFEGIMLRDRRTLLTNAEPQNRQTFVFFARS